MTRNAFKAVTAIKDNLDNTGESAHQRKRVSCNLFHQNSFTHQRIYLIKIQSFEVSDDEDAFVI